MGLASALRGFRCLDAEDTCRLQTKRSDSSVQLHGIIEAAMLAIEAGMTMEEINKCSLAASNAQLGYRRQGHGCLPGYSLVAEYLMANLSKLRWADECMAKAGHL